MKAIALARVSDEHQDSNEAQLVRINEYLKYKPHLELIKVFEIKESSTKKDRKRFQQIIKMIQDSKEPIALVVDTVDRMQRSFKESVLLDEMRKGGKVELHFYRENLVIHKDSNSADILRWDMAVMFAKAYILQLSDNVKRKFESMRRKGLWPGIAPIGYINTQKSETERWISPDPEKAHLIKLIFELYSTSTWSFKKIKQEVDRRGLKSRNDKRISIAMIHKIISNPFYYGVAVSKGREYAHKYEPLITKELFNACQKVRKSHNKKKVKYADIKFLFGKGIFTCADCGAVITAEKKTKPSGKTYTYYSCTGSRGCKRIYVSEAKILKEVQYFLKKLQKPEKWINEIVEGLRNINSSRREFHKTEVNRLQTEYNRLQNRIEQLPELLMDGHIDQQFYDKKIKEYKEDQRDTEVDLAMYTSADEEFHITAGQVLSLASRAYELFESSEIEEKQQILSYLFQNSTIQGKTIILQSREPFLTLATMNDQIGLPEVESFRTLDWVFIKSAWLTYSINPVFVA